MKQWKKTENFSHPGAVGHVGQRHNKSVMVCVYYLFGIAQNGKIRIFSAPDMVVSLQNTRVY